MKGLKTRLGALVLSAALVLTMTPSMLSNAEESSAPPESAGQISGTVDSDQVKEGSEETEGKDKQDPGQQGAQEDDKKDPSGTDGTEEQDENNVNDPSDEQNQGTDNANSQPDGQEEETEGQESSNGQLKDGKDQDNNETEPGSDSLDGQTPSANSIMLPEVQPNAVMQARTADITKPVVEGVEFEQNGQTLQEGDMLTFKVRAYDTESGIRELRVELRYQTGENEYEFVSHHIDGTYDEAQGCYVAEEELQNIGTGRVNVTEVYAVDQAGNYVEYPCEDLWFQTEAESDIASVSEISLDFNGKTVNEDDLSSDTIMGWVILDKKLEDESITLRFAGENGSEFTIDYYWNEQESRYDPTSGAGYTTPWSSGAETVKYVLSGIYVERFGGHVQIPMEGMENYYLYIEFNEPTEKALPQITSVELDKNAQTVEVGDTVTLTVKVDESEKMQDYGTAHFTPAEDIDVSDLYVDLNYDEAQQAYVGTLTVEEGTYPCEWYLDNISIAREDYSAWTDLDRSFEDIYHTYPWYFNVYNEDTFVTSAKNLSISFYRQDGSGAWTPVSHIQKENVPRRFTLKELGVNLPEMSSEIDGVSQNGWEDQSGNPVTEDTVLLNNSYIGIYASYDKNMVKTWYQYLSDDGTVKNESRMIEMGADATYGEYCKKAEEYVPADMTREYGFTGWETTSSMYEDSDSLEEHFYGSTFQAKYDGKTVVVLNKQYYDSQGYSVVETIPLVLDEGAAADGVIDYINAMDVPELYPGIRFLEWDVSPYLEKGDPLENFQWVRAYSLYENCLIRYEIYEDKVSDSRPDLLVCQVAEQGETVNVPDSFGDFSSVEWLNMPGDGESFVARGSVWTITGVGSRNGETVTQPETPENPNDPAKLSEETINYVVERINSAAEGSSVIVDMGNATVVPKDILETAKGKDIDVVLNMGGYTWTINGKDIFSENLKDIDLKVTLDTDNIPGSIIQALAGDNPAKQLSLAHNGDFGFLATLTVNVGAENAGRFGNLYYYDSDGRLIFMNAGTVTGEGMVSLDFSHASEYVIVMSEQQMSQAEADVVNNDTLNSGKGTDEASDKAVDKVSAKVSNQAAVNGAVKTGDTESGAASAAVLLVVSLAVIVAAGVAVRRRNVKR